MGKLHMYLYSVIHHETFKVVHMFIVLSYMYCLLFITMFLAL